MTVLRVLRLIAVVALIHTKTIRRVLLALPALLISLSVLAQQPQLPDTPAAHQFSAWLQAFNSGDRATFLKFLESNNPERAAHIDDDMNFRQSTGGFDFKKSEESTPTRFSALVQERNSDIVARLVIEVEPEAPHRITSMDLRRMPRPADLTIQRVSEDQTLTALKAKLQKDAAEDRFSGAVLVAKDGKPVFTGAYGLADREKKTPNKLNTQFRLGSMNKMFTAVATLQLVQAGKIKLTDPVGKYLADYPNKDLATKVTIHHLLTHTGGTGDFFGPQYDAHRLELRTLQDYVKLYGARGLQFEPGSRWEYSNYGFLLLGVIIEKASGQSYYDYVHEHIFKPAGMTLTDSLPEEQAVAGRSIGYMKSEDGKNWVSNANTLPYRGTSAGGGYSTVEDLLRFAVALQRHKLLDAQHTQLLTTGKVEAGPGGKYAYGFIDRTENGLRCFGHGGGAPGMNGDLEICQNGYVAVALANMDPPAAQNVTGFVTTRLLEK
ncbi:MAG: serine hydrolase [Candidatus Angelobacter sp. Gp1-AA117]|nr:MAG: serine hydrolase [Candidatus Angelobacter sp. Gp1-AA117]